MSKVNLTLDIAGTVFVRELLAGRGTRSLCAVCRREATRWAVAYPLIDARPGETDALAIIFRCNEHNANEAYVAFLERVKRSPIAVASEINDDA